MISFYYTLFQPAAQQENMTRGKEETPPGAGGVPPRLVYAHRLHSRSVYPDGSLMGSPAMSLA